MLISAAPDASSPLYRRIQWYGHTMLKGVLGLTLVLEGQSKWNMSAKFILRWRFAMASAVWCALLKYCGSSLYSTVCTLAICRSHGDAGTFPYADRHGMDWSKVGQRNGLGGVDGVLAIGWHDWPEFIQYSSALYSVEQEIACQRFRAERTLHRGSLYSTLVDSVDLSQTRCYDWTC